MCVILMYKLFFISFLFKNKLLCSEYNEPTSFTENKMEKILKHKQVCLMLNIWAVNNHSLL